ncbi:MAG: hypothetical protein ACLVI9_02130 [Anaerostipes hadrus]
MIIRNLCCQEGFAGVVIDGAFVTRGCRRGWCSNASVSFLEVLENVGKLNTPVVCGGAGNPGVISLLMSMELL